MKDGSKSFFAASKILPSNIRSSATALYAFCRLLDDLVDDQNASADVIPQIQERLSRIYQQDPVDVPADRALALVVERFGIPKILLEALIEGFQWDRDDRRYETIEDLQAYGARVASTVGVMMTLIMGVRDPVVLQRACELGLAMQLTNIARDVGEDARCVRLHERILRLQQRSASHGASDQRIANTASSRGRSEQEAPERAGCREHPRARAWE
jgi:phytoene synthase